MHSQLLHLVHQAWNNMSGHVVLVDLFFLIFGGLQVQYPGLEDQMKLDTGTMSFLSESIAWVRIEFLDTMIFFYW